MFCRVNLLQQLYCVNRKLLLVKLDYSIYFVVLA